MSRLTWDGTAKPVSRDQILRREQGQRKHHFSCSADHEQDWQQPYPVDPYPCYSYIDQVMAGQSFSASQIPPPYICVMAIPCGYTKPENSVSFNSTVNIVLYRDREGVRL